MIERIIRYVEINASGHPFHESTYSWVDGPAASEVWDAMLGTATAKGHTLVRLVDSPYARNPNLDDIEGDGAGGFRAKPGRTLTGVEVMTDA